MKRQIKKIALGLLIVFVLLQFIRPQKNNGIADTPVDITKAVNVPDTVMRLLKVSCYDCHSNKTVYPWYAEIAPGSWWLAGHIKNGKKELNFSEFSRLSARRMKNKLKSTAEQVDKREMPLKSYLLIHGNARLNEAQIKLIKDWTDTARQQLDAKNQ